MPYSIQLKNGEMVTIPSGTFATGASHDAVTVTDTTSINLTLSGQDISGNVLSSGVDHQSLGSILGSTSYYHLSSGNYDKVNSLSSSLTTGYLTSGDNISLLTNDTGYTTHSAVTVTDTTSVDFTLTGQDISANVKSSGVDHQSLSGTLGSTSYYHVSSGVYSVLTTGLSSSFSSGNYVPYSNATSTVALGSYGISGSTATFSSGISANNASLTSGLTATTGNFSSGIQVSGGATISGTLTCSSGATVAEGLDVSSSLNAIGHVIFSTGLGVTGATTFSTGIQVDGQAIFSTSISITGTAGMSSNATIDGTLTVAKLLTASSGLTINSSSLFLSTLQANGKAIFSSAVEIGQLLTCDSGVVITNNLSVTGNSTMSGALSLTGNFLTSGTAGITGATILSSTLEVTGLATFSSGATFIDSVGIGTTSPNSSATLHLANTTSTILFIESSGSGLSMLRFHGDGYIESNSAFADLILCKGANKGRHIYFYGGDTAIKLFIKSNGDVETVSTGAYYFGDSTVEGTWRIVRSGNNLQFQRRESSSWISKGQFTT